MSTQRSMINEFKPTIYFLGKFVLIYFIGNLLYGLFVTSYKPTSDPITSIVTRQSAVLLNVLGWDVTTMDDTFKPNTYVEFEGRSIIAVYEGCNGINVMIIFIAFLFAFGPIVKTLWWFLPVGIIVIHLSNLIRLILLFIVSIDFPKYLYFTHKYLFTGIIYLITFLLWVWWVQRYGLTKRN